MNGQRNLYGKVVDIASGPQRRRIKISGNTDDILNRARVSKPLNKMEIVMLGTKLAVLVLNRMPDPDDIIRILSSDDLDEIEETLSKLYIKNSPDFR